MTFGHQLMELVTPIMLNFKGRITHIFLFCNLFCYSEHIFCDAYKLGKKAKKQAKKNSGERKS